MSQPANDRSIFRHPLLITVVTGCLGVLGVIIGVIFNRPPSVAELADAKAKVVELQSEVDQLKRDNTRFKFLNSGAQTPPPESFQVFMESFVIPNGKFMDAGDKNFFITVDAVQGSVAEIGVKRPMDFSGFVDRRFVTKGSIIRMVSDTVTCMLEVLDVGGGVVNVQIKCTKSAKI